MDQGSPRPGDVPGGLGGDGDAFVANGGQFVGSGTVGPGLFGMFMLRYLQFGKERITVDY